MFLGLRPNPFLWHHNKQIHFLKNHQKHVVFYHDQKHPSRPLIFFHKNQHLLRLCRLTQQGVEGNEGQKQTLKNTKIKTY